VTQKERERGELGVCLLGRVLDRVKGLIREDGFQREEAGEGCGSRSKQGCAGGKILLFFLRSIRRKSGIRVKETRRRTHFESVFGVCHR